MRRYFEHERIDCCPTLRAMLGLVAMSVLLAQPANCQSLEEVRRELLPLEDVSQVRIAIVLTFKDSRVGDPALMVPLDDLARRIQREDELGLKPLTEDQIRPLQAHSELSFLGLEKNEAGRWRGRIVMALRVQPPGSQEIALKLSGQDLWFERGKLSEDKRRLWFGNLAIEASRELNRSIDSLSTALGLEYRRVSVIGWAPSTQLTPEAIERAVQVAKVSAQGKAWGVAVQSQVVVVDRGASTRVDQSTTGGHVEWYRVKDSYTRLTSDGNVVVLVEAVVRR